MGEGVEYALGPLTENVYSVPDCAGVGRCQQPAVGEALVGAEVAPGAAVVVEELAVPGKLAVHVASLSGKCTRLKKGAHRILITYSSAVRTNVVDRKKKIQVLLCPLGECTQSLSTKPILISSTYRGRELSHR